MGEAINIDFRVYVDHRLTEKGNLNFKEKAAIGKQAAKLIKDGDTNILDSRTTTNKIIKNTIHMEKLIKISNAFKYNNKRTYQRYGKTFHL